MLHLPDSNRMAAAGLATIALMHANKRIMASKGLTDIPVWCILSKPYLRAIAQMNYGMEYPDMVILKALDILHSWRGEQARMVKAEMKKLLVEDGQ
jgi:hypothetical protein